jgi:hypothetical protein
MRKVHQKFMIGVRLFEEWHMVKALALAEGLVRSEDEMDATTGTRGVAWSSKTVVYARASPDCPMCERRGA